MAEMEAHHKAAREMTTQERAAALLERMGLCGHPAASQFVGDIIEHDQQTRRAALLEAAKLVGDYNCMHDHGKKATKACDDVFDELHRLAQEGS